MDLGRKGNLHTLYFHYHPSDVSKVPQIFNRKLSVRPDAVLISCTLVFLASCFILDHLLLKGSQFEDLVEYQRSVILWCNPILAGKNSRKEVVITQLDLVAHFHFFNAVWRVECLLSSLLGGM